MTRLSRSEFDVKDTDLDRILVSDEDCESILVEKLIGSNDLFGARVCLIISGALVKSHCRRKKVTLSKARIVARHDY